MSGHNSPEEIGQIIEVAVRGLWRFYDEGFRRWPYAKLAPLFSNRDLENPEIQQELRRLEVEGFIKLHRAPECYVEVLQVPR